LCVNHVFSNNLKLFRYLLKSIILCLVLLISKTFLFLTTKE